MQPHLGHHPPDGFPTDPSGLPEAGRPRLLELADGDTLKLGIAPVAKTLGDTTVRMLAYNGSIPGPTLKVRQGSELVVQVENQGDLEATVHWHGLRVAIQPELAGWVLTRSLQAQPCRRAGRGPGRWGSIVGPDAEGSRRTPRRQAGTPPSAARRG